MSEPITIVTSIDTEEDNWDPARERITVENIRELPRLDRLFERLGVRATYFTTHKVAETAWCVHILRGLVAGGGGRAEVGTHLHPWNTPPVELELTPRNTMLGNLPRDLQRAKIFSLTELLALQFGQRPSTFRAGRWGFTRVTAGILMEAGYRVDSSVTPYRSWEGEAGINHIGAPINVYRIDGRGDHRVDVPDGALVEVPLSWGYTHGAWGVISQVDRLVSRRLLSRIKIDRAAELLHVMNHLVLSPEVEATDDMVRLARALIARGARHLHLTFHSPSLVPGLTPFASTAKQVDQLYGRIGEFAERISALGPVRFATVGEAGALLAPQPTPAPASPSAFPDPSFVHTKGKKLVVVTYHFPPDPAIGGLRWSGLTKYLGEIGWRSWVVAAAGGQGVVPGVTVVHRPRRTTLNDLYRRYLSRHPSAPDAADDATPDKRKWTQTLRYEGGMLLYLPDEARGWILRAARAARRLIKTERPDVVISSGPPHSAHLAAWLATRFRPVPWFVDLRDPWAGPLTAAWKDTPFFQSPFARWLTKRLEGLALRAATGVICNTREFTDALIRRYPDLHIQWVPNAVDRALLPPRGAGGSPFPGLALAHVGTVYGGRDLGPILKGMRRLFDQTPEAARDGTRLRLAGSLEDPYATAFRQQVRELGLGDWVETLGILPRSEALALVSRSRLALVLAQGQEFQVPAKLYELVAMGIPTLVVATAASAASTEARRVGAAALDPDDVDGIAAFLEQVRNGGGTIPASKGEAVDYRMLARKVATVLTTRGAD